MQTDYAGQTVPVVDPVSGVIFPAQIFVAVLIIECWILARVWNRSFFSLAELNAAIAELLEELNNRPMRHVGKKPPRTQRPPHRAPRRQHAKAKSRTLLTGTQNGEINHP
jgi:hypothetical protein